MIIKVSIPNRFQLKTVPSFKTVLMPKQSEVHYIGGADILPAPLEPEEESRMIGMLSGEEDQKARAALIEHNLRLVVYIAKKFDNTSVGVEDLISIGTIGLIKAINTFKPDKNIKLATYASRCIENEILMYLRRNNKTRMEVSIDEPLNVDWDGNELLLSDILGTDEDVIYHDIEDEIEKNLLNNAISRLNPRERKIVELRYGLTNEDGEEMKSHEEISASESSEAPEPGRAVKWFDCLHGDEMVWDDVREYDLEEFPGITFRWTSEQLDAVKGSETTPLYNGMPIWSVYFCDLTGDGKPELCSTLSMGSGIVNDQILVYDYADGTGYDLSDRENFDYVLTVQEDSLIAEKRAYQEDDLIESGELVLSDGILQIKPQ